MTETVPRQIAPTPTRADVRFRRLATAAGASTLILTGFITLFLFVESLPAFREAGFSFLTTTAFSPDAEKPMIGIAAMGFGTLVVAIIALAVAVPVAIGTSVFINEYAPVRTRRGLTALVDLMAAVPSVIFGIWGVFFMLPRLNGSQQWIATHLSFIPFFRVESTIGRSLFEAGLIVSLMVIPITTSIMREVLAQAPRHECEAALALGGTRWGMVRTVVLPFGRGGLIGASMLGLGRALGETIAVALVLSFSFRISGRILESGGASIASVIAVSFGEAGKLGVRALLAAGLTLFLATLLVNLAAASIVGRARTGTGVEL